jgi:hypothetical protein
VIVASEKKAKLKGLAALMNGQLEPVNNMPKFKELFGSVDLKIILVATDMYPAALIHADHGVIKVSAVSQEDCKNWKKTGAQGLLQCTTAQLLAIYMGSLNPKNAWFKRQIKIRGPINVQNFYSMINAIKPRK